MGEKRILVAKFGAAQGVRGEVRLFAYMDDPASIAKLGMLEDKTGARKFKILSSRPAKDFLVVRIEGIDDRNAAEKLTHIELYVSRDRLPKQKDKSVFYQTDLIGLRAEDRGGKILGDVVSLQNFGAGDLLEIRPASGGDTFYVPFSDPFVPVVNVEGGNVVLDLPDNFFDAGENEEAANRSAP